MLELIAQIRQAQGDSAGGLDAILAGRAHADRVGSRPKAIGIIWVAANLLAASDAHELVAVTVGITHHGPNAAMMNLMVGERAEQHAVTAAARAALDEDR